MNFLTTAQLAQLLHLHPTTLVIWRMKGKGPPWRKIGKRVLYDTEQARLWVDAQIGKVA
jgi:DNA-binding transcriptional MerR regulator